MDVDELIRHMEKILETSEPLDPKEIGLDDPACERFWGPIKVKVVEEPHEDTSSSTGTGNPAIER